MYEKKPLALLLRAFFNLPKDGVKWYDVADNN